MVFPLSTGIFAAITSSKVLWSFPPKGIITVPAPMVESNFSTKPFLLQQFKSPNILSHEAFKSLISILLSKYDWSFGALTKTSAFWVTPFVFKKSLLISTIAFPFHSIISLLLSVTVATAVASKFSSKAKLINLSLSFFETTTAILSWDSEIANSVPSSPSYFLVTRFKFILSPSASSPIATQTPPAPKSLHFFIILETSDFLKSLWIALSIKAFPFWTSAPQFTIDFSVCFLDEPVAPPHPSLPVLPPRRIITSEASGVFLTTFSFGTAPITAPISIRFAT